MYSNTLICNILKFIDENINSKISIEDLEYKFFYNRFYIMKLFKKEMDITIIDYINSLRIYSAIIDIKDTNNTLLSIAFKNGFYSIEYFSETFKKIVGINPRMVKNYFTRKSNIGINSANIINKSIIDLYSLKEKKEKYLSNKNPATAPVKKLSIFK